MREPKEDAGVMKSVAIAEAKSHLSSLVDEVRTSRKAIEIRKRDQPAAYLVEAETYKRLQGIEDSVRAEQIRRALKGPKYDIEEVLRSIDLGL
jgi:prevent-host-death family protein